MMKRFLSTAAGLMLALSLSVTALAGVLWVLGTSETVMLPMMRHYAPSESTQLPDEEYPGMVHMITGYLAGDVEDFQYHYFIFDVMYPAFQPHEQQHMEDCRALFRLDRKVLYAGAILSAVLAATAVLRENRRVWRWTTIGLAAIEVAVVLVALAAVVDFDRLFILFHRLSFSNDLWLLDPRTDLLIRLMPTRFFMTYAAILGVSWLALITLMQLGALILYKRGKQ